MYHPVQNDPTRASHTILCLQYKRYTVFAYLNYIIKTGLAIVFNIETFVEDAQKCVIVRR